MSKQFIGILLSGLGLLLILMSCTSTGATKDTSSQDRSVVQVEDTDITLADHLSKVSGVTVRGSGSNVSVNIRGVSSFRGDTRPLYVVDGQRLGNDYSYVASQIPVTDIKSIRVLKGAEASPYGIQGGNGVIEITTEGN